MAYQLKGVWSTIGAPTFDNQQDFERAKRLAGMDPYNIRWDKDSDGVPYFTIYGELYGNDAAATLERTRIEGKGNGLVVVSGKQEWALPGAILFQADPTPPPPEPGPGEVRMQTPWGSINQKELLFMQQILTAATYLSRESLMNVIKQLNAMLA